VPLALAHIPLATSLPLPVANRLAYEQSVNNMPSPYPSNENGNSEDSSKKASSWFGSWFENDNSNLKQEIHHKLNEFDDYQRRYERENPSSLAGSSGPSMGHPSIGRGQPASLQQEMEEFFEAAGLGGIANHPPQWTTSSSSSSSSTSSSFRGQQGGRYQMMRKENQHGVQIDVQFPRAIDAESVAVEVLQESPCVVQWGNASNKDGAGRAFQDRARLGEAIDCSKLSASISSAQKNMLTVKAPRYSSAASGQEKPRIVPVTERDE
jgi:hypothetical protein